MNLYKVFFKTDTDWGTLTFTAKDPMDAISIAADYFDCETNNLKLTVKFIRKV
jgi:hypothetical protein